MQPTSNSARRLHNLLTRLMNTARPNMTLDVAWATTFNISPERTSQLLRYIGFVNDLADEVEADIRSIEDLGANKYLRYFPNIRKGLSQLNLKAPAENITKDFKGPVIESIAICADILESRTDNEKDVKEDLFALAEEMTDLRERVLKSELPEDLKNFVSQSLAEMVNAIFTYQIHGAKAVHKEIERVLGGLYTRFGSDYIQKTNSDLVKEYIDLTSKLIKIVQGALTIPILTDQLAGLLGMG